jgi:hypothetical protein
MAAFATLVQKNHRYGGKTAPIPPKNTIKKRVKILKKTALPPLKICESMTLTKFFFYLALVLS